MDNPLKSRFMKVFDDLFTHRQSDFEFGFRKMSSEYKFKRGARLSGDPTYDRFLPESYYIKEDNRFSPSGVEWLYLAASRYEHDAEECTIKECRAISGERFGICNFSLVSGDYKVVNLTLADNYSFTELDDRLENIAEVIRNKTIRKSLKVGIALPPSENDTRK